MKKLISVILIITLLFSFMVIPTNAESDEDTVTPTLENNISVDSTNSFGGLISQTINSEMEKQLENNGFNVFSVEYSEGEALVELEALQDCTLFVGIYSEDGKELITSQNLEVTRDDTLITLTFDTSIVPEYFIIQAYLINTKDLKPLCSVYTSNMYTKEMQEFLSKTTDDFEEDKVLQLNDDKTNNFAVYNDSVEIIEENLEMTVTSDEENGVYTVTNPTDEVKALQVGDIFSYSYENGEVLIVKIASVSTDENGVITYTEGELELEDVFDYIKIDTETPTNSATVDTSMLDDSIVYNGCTENPSTFSLIDTEVTNKFSHKYEFLDHTLIKAESNEGIIKISVNGSLAFEVSCKFKAYIALDKSTVEIKIDYKATPSIELSGSVKGQIPLGEYTLVAFTGIYIKIEPSFIIETTGEIGVDASVSGSLGFQLNTKTGFKDLTKTPRIEAEVKAEATIFVGVSFKPTVSIIHEKIAKTSIDAVLGGEIKGTQSLGVNTEDERHTCKHCLVGEIYGKFDLKYDVKLLNNDKWSFKYTLANVKLKVSDFYFSSDFLEFGFTKCPHKEYKLTVNVKDNNNRPLNRAQVKIGGKTATTNTLGNASFYLPNACYTVSISNKNYRTVTKSVTVNSKAQKININLSLLADGVDYSLSSIVDGKATIKVTLPAYGYVQFNQKLTDLFTGAKFTVATNSNAETCYLQLTADATAATDIVPVNEYAGVNPGTVGMTWLIYKAGNFVVFGRGVNPNGLGARISTYGRFSGNGIEDITFGKLSNGKVAVSAREFTTSGINCGFTNYAPSTKTAKEVGLTNGGYFRLRNRENKEHTFTITIKSKDIKKSNLLEDLIITSENSDINYTASSIVDGKATIKVTLPAKGYAQFNQKLTDLIGGTGSVKVTIGDYANISDYHNAHFYLQLTADATGNDIVPADDSASAPNTDAISFRLFGYNHQYVLFTTKTTSGAGSRYYTNRLNNSKYHTDVTNGMELIFPENAEKNNKVQIRCKRQDFINAGVAGIYTSNQTVADINGQDGVYVRLRNNRDVDVTYTLTIKSKDIKKRIKSNLFEDLIITSENSVISTGVYKMSSGYENSTITTETFSLKNTATSSNEFDGLIPNFIYNYYVMESDGVTNPLNPENLKFIGQAISDENGNLTLPEYTTNITSSEPTIVLKEFTRVSGEWEYLISNNDTAIITGCTADNVVSIPEKLEDYIPTAIANMAFEGCYNLTDVTLSNSITEIADGTFYAQKNINLHNSCKYDNTYFEEFANQQEINFSVIHQYAESILNEIPTEEKEGSVIHTCTDCNHNETLSLPYLKFKPSLEIVGKELLIKFKLPINIFVGSGYENINVTLNGEVIEVNQENRYCYVYSIVNSNNFDLKFTADIAADVSNQRFTANCSESISSVADFNSDAKFNITDLVKMDNSVASNEECDINGDDSSDSADLELLRKVLLLKTN